MPWVSQTTVIVMSQTKLGRFHWEMCLLLQSFSLANAVKITYRERKRGGHSNQTFRSKHCFFWCKMYLKSGVEGARRRGFAPRKEHPRYATRTLLSCKGKKELYFRSKWHPSTKSITSHLHATSAWCSCVEKKMERRLYSWRKTLGRKY